MEYEYKRVRNAQKDPDRDLDAEARRRLRWLYKRLDTPARRKRHRPHKDSYRNRKR